MRGIRNDIGLSSKARGYIVDELVSVADFQCEPRSGELLGSIGIVEPDILNFCYSKFSRHLLSILNINGDVQLTGTNNDTGCCLVLAPLPPDRNPFAVQDLVKAVMFWLVTDLHLVVNVWRRCNPAHKERFLLEFNIIGSSDELSSVTIKILDVIQLPVLCKI
jgi:hypothetical protein